jgi:hypothetical protein
VLVNDKRIGETQQGIGDLAWWLRAASSKASTLTSNWATENPEETNTFVDDEAREELRWTSASVRG